jgi:hypothetical protein
MTDNMNEREEQSQTKQTDQESRDSQSIVNQRITIAGGFLDFALFIADVEHLKFIIETGKEDVK